jgi:hypothetical protein
MKRVCVAFLTGFALMLNGCVTQPTHSKSSAVSGASNDWVFIDNGKLRLGVIKSSGAGIGWLSQGAGARNLINHWDRGRLVQQSYYGSPDGSLWNKQPWSWNPVQGGDWQGNPATVFELKSGKDHLYARSQAKHWASGAELTEVVFEEWITLKGNLAQVHFKMSYSGTNSHPRRSHEIPALFCEPDLDTLVLYPGVEPWQQKPLSRTKPGWPNEARVMGEPWAAYVDKHDFGIGACVPVAKQLTCYRFGDGKPEHGSCSYFAPIIDFAITPGTVFEYDLFLTIGQVDEMRATFRGIVQNTRRGR